MSPSPKGLPGSLRTLHLLKKKQAAESGRPTQKLPPPTRKLRAVTWKVAGDVSVLDREKFGYIAGEKKKSDGNGIPAGRPGPAD